ncbi:Fc.00g095410.m01.CDS01 [Cosmosporella sp. VM-42]
MHLREPNDIDQFLGRLFHPIHATPFDRALFIACITECTAAGAATPMMMVFVGSLAGKFSDFLSGTIETGTFDRAVSHQALMFVYIGVSQLVVLIVGIYGLNHIGERITGRLRRAFLDAVLRQNVAFFDSHGAGEIAVSLSNDISLVQDGVSQKVGLIGVGLGGFLSTLIVAFVRDWRLALVLLCLPVIIILIMGGLGASLKRYQEKSTTGFAKTGNLAEEVISCIRNVTAFGSQHLMLRKYKDSLAEPAKDDFAAKLMMGLIVAIIMGVVNSANGLAFWQGNRFLNWGDGDVAATVTVLFTSILSRILLGHAAPFAAALVQAGAAASRIFPIIDRISPIDPLSDKGFELDVVEGAIELKAVKFKYPSRPDQTILKSF